MNIKQAFINVIDKDGEIEYSREFDSIKEAKQFVKDCGKDPSYWDRFAEVEGWHKRIDHLELVVDGENLQDFYLKIKQ